MKAPLVGIVILNYRNYNDTIQCVSSLERINYPSFRIIIVDNDSGNGSEEALRERFPDHVFLQTGRNGGYAAGNNAGIRRALEEGADYVLILNNDTLAVPDFLGKLVAYAESNPLAGVVGPKVVDEEGNLDVTCARRRLSFADYFWLIGPGRWIAPHNKWRKMHYYAYDYDFELTRQVDIISGSCMLIRSKVLEEIGLLDENTFLFYEEFILHEKMRKTAFFTAIVPSSIVIHRRHRAINACGRKVMRHSLNSAKYYLRTYRDFGKSGTAFAIVCFEIHWGIKAARAVAKSYFSSIMAGKWLHGRIM